MASNSISCAQIEEELTQVFKKFNVNGDDKILLLELGVIMGSLGNDTTMEELDMMIRKVDADGDGFIYLNEFLELNMKDIDSNKVLENLNEVFSVFGMDKNGSISAEKLQNVMKNIGDVNKTLSLADGVVFGKHHALHYNSLEQSPIVKANFV